MKDSNLFRVDHECCPMFLSLFVLYFFVKLVALPAFPRETTRCVAPLRGSAAWLRYVAPLRGSAAWRTGEDPGLLKRRLRAGL